MSDTFRGLDRNKGIYWVLAEIFNNVILSTEEFKSVLGTEGDTRYPEHKRILSRARELYKKSSDIDLFIINLFKYLKSWK